MMEHIQLGQQAEDIITGFTGIIIGRAEYLTGCTQYGLAPKAEPGKPTTSSEWFDKGRIRITGPGITPADVKAPEDGGPNRDSPAGN